MEFLKKRKTVFIYLAAFFLPVLMLGIVMIARNIYPFGDTNILIWDMEVQYINIYGWFRDVLHGNASLFYDFSKSLGGNMYGVFGCYLANPINLLIYFFPVKKIVDFITLATVLKIALSGLFCAIYLKKRFSISSARVIVLLACGYAMMEYNISFSSNLHFLDGVYTLPLLCLGVYTAVRGKGFYGLALSSAYCIFSNWYVGYMCCFFSILYFIFEWVIYEAEAKEKFYAFVRYTISMLTGVFIGSITFIPSILSSTNGKGSLDLTVMLKGFHNNFWIGFKSFMLTSRGNENYDEAAIYVGGFAMVLFFLFFVIKGVKLRERIAGGVILFVVFLSFSLVPLEVIWTMLKQATSFHFRYSFVFSFFIITMAGIAWERLEQNAFQISKLRGGIALGLLISTSLILLSIANKKMASDYVILFLMILTFGILFAFQYFEKMQIKRICFVLIGLFCIGDLTYNAYDTFDHYSISEKLCEKYFDGMNKEIKSVTNSDKEFYRMEKTVSNMTIRDIDYMAAGEGMMFNYNSITHYSSFYDAPVNDFLARMGYCKSNAMWSNYNDVNPVSDSLLGVKYVITNKPPAMMTEVGTSDLPEGYHLYQNDLALPFGFEIDSQAVTPSIGWNPFYNQQKMFRQMLGDSELKSPYSVQTPVDKGDSTWEITAEQSGYAMAFFASGHIGTVDVALDNQVLQEYYSRGCKNVISLGNFIKGDTFTISLLEDNCQLEHNLKVVILREKQFYDIIERLKEKSFLPSYISDDHIEGDYDTLSSTSLVLQVPYDEGWKITDNGKVIEPDTFMNCFIRLNLPSGNHHIEMDYVPPMFNVGCEMTFAGIILLMVLEGFRLWKLKKGKEND